jgi:hypothetical protein
MTVASREVTEGESVVGGVVKRAIMSITGDREPAY